MNLTTQEKLDGLKDEMRAETLNYSTLPNPKVLSKFNYIEDYEGERSVTFDLKDSPLKKLSASSQIQVPGSPQITPETKNEYSFGTSPNVTLANISWICLETNPKDKRNRNRDDNLSSSGKSWNSNSTSGFESIPDEN